MCYSHNGRLIQWPALYISLHSPFNYYFLEGSGLMFNVWVFRHVLVCLFVWLPSSSGNVLCYSSLSLVSSLKSLLSHSSRPVLELTPLLFAPLHRLWVCLRGEGVRRRWCCLLCLWVPPRWAVITPWHRVHSTAAGEPLCREPSFPSVSNSQWHLFRAAQRLCMPRATREGRGWV